MTDPHLITIEDLQFTYPNGVMALTEVSLKIDEGRKIVFLGPNGAGKSTLFLHLNGILRPKKGRVLFQGVPIKYDQRSLAILREQVAMVLQNPDDQIFSSTVEEDVAFGPLNLLLDRREVEARVEESLYLVGLEELRDRPTQQLSFGQKKRVSLAGALAMHPKVLIMDEPTAGLDSEMVHELMELSDELNHRGMTLIISTHDIETAYEWADGTVVMDKGRIMFSGTPEDLFDHHELIDRLRIVPPFLVRMNRQRHYRSGLPERPIPRNLVELTHKCFPSAREGIDAKDGALHIPLGERMGGPGGTLFLVDVDDPYRSDRARMLGERILDIHFRSGAYGARPRRLVREGKIDVHHPFHALENAILEVSLGHDYVLYTDPTLMSLVESELRRVETRVGLRTKVVRTGGGEAIKGNGATDAMDGTTDGQLDG